MSDEVEQHLGKTMVKQSSKNKFFFLKIFF
jgi:hypothetical protein